MMAALEAMPVLSCFYLPSLVASFPSNDRAGLCRDGVYSGYLNQERIAYARCSFGMRWSPSETACITEIDSREDAFIYNRWGRVETGVLSRGREYPDSPVRPCWEEGVVWCDDLYIDSVRSWAVGGLG